MKPEVFLEAFERMRTENLGQQFERRELGILATRYGIYFNSTMWACKLDRLFKKGRLGQKFVYSFRNTTTKLNTIEELFNDIKAYKRNTDRTIEHAKSILRRFGIRRI